MWRKSSKLQWMQLKKKSLMLPFKNWKTWPLHRWTQCWKSSQDKRSCRKEMTGEECHATMYPLPHQVHVLYSWKCIGMVTYAFLNLSTHSLGFHKIIIITMEVFEYSLLGTLLHEQMANNVILFSSLYPVFFLSCSFGNSLKTSWSFCSH